MIMAVFFLRAGWILLMVLTKNSIHPADRSCLVTIIGNSPQIACTAGSWPATSTVEILQIVLMVRLVGCPNQGKLEPGGEGFRSGNTGTAGGECSHQCQAIQHFAHRT